MGQSSFLHIFHWPLVIVETGVRIPEGEDMLKKKKTWRATKVNEAPLQVAMAFTSNREENEWVELYSLSPWHQYP